MPLIYDPTSEMFVISNVATGMVRRFEVGVCPTLENAMLALELLEVLRSSTPKPKNVDRPGPVHSRILDEEVKAYIDSGGHIIRAVEYHPEPKSRLKPAPIQAKTGAELLALLNIKPKEPACE